MKPTEHDVIQWARTVWPGVFRGPGPMYHGYVEFAELAYAAGRKAGMEEAADIADTTWSDDDPGRAIRAAMEADK